MRNNFITLVILIFGFLFVAIPSFADDEIPPENEILLPEVFTIDTALDWAYEHNRELERLRMEVAAAQQSLRGSRLLYTPTVEIGGRSMQVGPASSMMIPMGDAPPMEIETSTTDITHTLSFTFNQPVYMFGTFRLARESSDLALEQAELNLRRAERTVRNDVENAFLQAVLASELERVQMQAVVTADERLRIAEVRFDAGDAARFETLRAQVDLAAANEELLQLETGSELASAFLTQKLGLPSGTVINIESPAPEDIETLPPIFTLLDAWDSALENRSDLLNLELALELADIGVSMQRNRPSLAFQGNYSYSDIASGFGDNESWSLILNLSYALFDSGKADAAEDEARWRRDALGVQLEDTRTLIQLEVESAYRSLIESLERIEVSEATLEVAAEAVRIAQLGYEEGVIPYIDFQDADLSFRQSEILYLRAVYGYLMAKSDLEAAVGFDLFGE